MNNNVNSDQSSSRNVASSSLTRYSTPTLSRRSSLKTSSRVSASPGSGSVRGGVSKIRRIRGTSKTSKSKRKSTKNIELATNNSDNDATDEMEDDDIDSLGRQLDSNEASVPLNVSAASADTVVNKHSNTRRKSQTHAAEYFVLVKETGKYKCTICAQVKKSLLLFQQRPSYF